MTRTLEIQLTDGTPEFDFLSGPTGNLFLIIGSRTTIRRPDNMWEERVILIGKGTQSLTVNIEWTLGLIGSRVRNYANDPNFVSDRYWLAEKAEGESDNRRALLYDVEILPSDRRGFMRLQNLGMSYYEMVMVRDEWESTSPRTAIAQADMAAGDKKTIPARGTLPGRIDRVLLEPGASIGTGAAATARHWLGIRPTYHGTTGFISEWDWTAGTMGADASVVSGNVEIDFGTVTAMVPRVTLKLSDIVGSNYDHFVGEYLLLMSIEVGGGGSTRVAMQVSGDGVSSEPIYSGSTASLSQIFEVGTIRIPDKSIRDVNVSLADVEIVFSAELIASISTITIDKVYAVPAKHFCYLEGSLDSAQASGYVELRMHPEGEPLQINSDGSAVGFGNPIIVNWAVPVEGGIFVYVGGAPQGTIAGGVDLTLDIVDRWEGYRV